MARFNHAVTQVEEWQLGALKYPGVLEHAGIHDVNFPDGTVVMGRDADISNSKRRERWHQRWQESKLDISTWDHILNRGRLMGERFGNPDLPGTDWT